MIDYGFKIDYLSRYGYKILVTDTHCHQHLSFFISDVDSDELEFIVNEEMQQYQILHEAVIIQQNKELHEILGSEKFQAKYLLKKYQIFFFRFRRKFI